MGRPKPSLRSKRVWTKKELQMREFELKMRKYYSKKAISLYHGSHYQRICSDNFKDPDNWALQRYKRSFFRTFDANSSRISQIPHNVRHLILHRGSKIVLRKFLKQNKRLESLVFAVYDRQILTKMMKYLKYSRSLRSIRFPYGPYSLTLLSDMECRKMLKTWGKRIEKIEIGSDGKNSNAMETFLQFPKLKEFQLGSFIPSFPYDKLQERKIESKISLSLENNESLGSFMENPPKFELTDYVCLKKGPSFSLSKKISLEMQKIERNSKQKLFLNLRNEQVTAEDSLKLIFQNILCLDLTVSRDEWANSRIEKMNNLKHLSIEMRDYREKKKDGFEDFFKYLNQNVAPHKKLETLLIKADVRGQKKQNKNLAVSFFEACSATLKKVHFEFDYLDPEVDEAECFYEGLKKLKNLQSLSLFLNFHLVQCEKTIEKLGQIISKIKSLKEVDFNIQKNNYQGKPLNLKFPPKLKKLSLGMDTSGAPFEASKILWPLSHLTYLEFEFVDFSSPKWSKILHDMANKLKFLGVLILKKTQNLLSRKETSKMKERFDALMTESGNLKLIVFVTMESKEMMIFKRNNYLWSQINPIIDDLSFQKDIKVSEIKSYT